jgi:hypothetical protein
MMAAQVWWSHRQGRALARWAEAAELGVFEQDDAVFGCGSGSAGVPAVGDDSGVVEAAHILAEEDFLDGGVVDRSLVGPPLALNAD